MAKRCLGIEITSTNIRVIEMITTVPPKVVNFASVKVLSEYRENVCQQILSILADNDFGSKRAGVAIGESTIHRVTSLPPMPKKEMKVVVERELKGLPTTPAKEMALEWQIIGEGRDRKRLVLIAGIPAPLVKEQATFLRDLGLRCNLITTTPFALFSSLKLIEGIDNKAIALIHFGEKKIYTIFLRRGRWVFHREFPYNNRTEIKQLILPDVKRSFLYYRHQFRGESIDLVYISGDFTEDMERSCTEVLEVRTERFLPVLDLSPLKAKAVEFRRVLPEFMVPIGLAGRDAKDCICFTVQELKREDRLKVVSGVAVAGLVIIALFLGRGYWKLLQDISDYKRIYLEKKKEITQLQPYLNALGEKERYESNLKVLRCIDNHVVWMEMLRELSLIVPPEIAFQSLLLKREQGKTKILIKGDIFTPQNSSGLEAFNLFYSRLESSSFFAEIKVNPGSIMYAKAGEESQTMSLGFEVNGELAPIEIEYN